MKSASGLLIRLINIMIVEILHQNTYILIFKPFNNFVIQQLFQDICFVREGLTTQLRLMSNLQPSCLSFLSTGIIGMQHSVHGSTAFLY